MHKQPRLSASQKHPGRCSREAATLETAAPILEVRRRPVRETYTAPVNHGTPRGFGRLALECGGGRLAKSYPAPQF
jgi:hypothetical protein